MAKLIKLYMAIAVFCACVTTVFADAVNARILEYGIYEPVGRTRVIHNISSLSGTTELLQNVRFIAHTDKVPARLGTSFGFGYSIAGLASMDTIALQKVVKHPPIRNVSGRIETHYSLTYRSSLKDSSASVWGYGFDRPEELVPGVWVFELRYAGRKLLSQSFTVYVVADKH